MNPRYSDRKTRAEMLAEMGTEADATVHKTAKRIAHSTLRFTNSEGVECVRYQRTNVIELKGSKLRLNSGGWKTPTTKRRINDYAPVRLYTSWDKPGGWVVSVTGVENAPTYRFFFDGIEFNTKTGRIYGGKRAERKAEATAHKEAKLRAKINKFAGRLRTEPIPNIESGDCFYCQMREAGTGKDVLPFDCVRLHVDENYLHGSLVLRAIQRSGYKPEFWFRPGVVSPQVARMVRRFCLTACGLQA